MRVPYFIPPSAEIICQAIRLYVQHIKTGLQVKPRWPRRGKIPLNFLVWAGLPAGTAGVDR